MSHRKKIYKQGQKDLIHAMEKAGVHCFAKEERHKTFVDFSKESTVKDGAKALAVFHKSAKEAFHHDMVLPQKNPFRYLHRTEMLLQKTEEHRVITLAEYAFSLLCDGTLGDLTLEMKEKGDIAFGKINGKTLEYQEKSMCFRGGHGISEDLAILDLWRLFRQYLKDPKAKEDVILSAIEAYREIKPLTPKEERALFGYLLLPYEPLKHPKDVRVSKKRMEWYESVFQKGSEVNCEAGN